MDDKLTLMLVEDDPLTCKDIFTELTACSDDFALVGITNNAARAMECVTEYCPDAIVVDLELKDGTSEGLSFLQTLKSSEMAPLPFILAITGSNDPDVRGSARECGADFIMGKSDAGFSAQNIADFMKLAKSVIFTRKDHLPANASSASNMLDERRTHRRISQELDKVGISSKSVGYRYLIDSIAVKIEKPVQHVCRIVGKKHGKTENSVERAMQNAINRAWASTDKNELATHYTARIKSAKGIPTITEFIFYYAQKLNNEF